MPRTWICTLERGTGAPWLARSPLGQGIVLFFGVLVALVLIPIVIIGIALGLLGLAGAAVRRRLARLRAPNGALDGRRNVRVRIPDDNP